MFRRQWIWFGKLVSDEGFTLAYGHRSVTYADDRGSFQFGYEDGLLFGPPRQVRGNPVSLTDEELKSIAERVISGIRFEGHAVEIAKR